MALESYDHIDPDGARQVFTTQRQTLLAPSAKRREAFGESHMKVVYGGGVKSVTRGVNRRRPWYLFYKAYFKDVSRELDEFRVNTHLCNAYAALLVLVIYYKNIGAFLLGRFYFLSNRLL